MDARLSRYLDGRLVKLRRSDVPLVAKAIVGHIRGQYQASRSFVHNTGIIRIWGGDLEVVVRAEDWEKIIPYLRDGYFNPQLFPTNPLYTTSSKVHMDPATLDLDDPELYQRVLGVLETLFPDDYPTSDL